MAGRPSLIFVLLDCGRADRFSAWGNVHATTPKLDALAGTGVRFARHFANAHATRSSMPQLMSGRYYHPDVLRAFEPRSNPHEYPFREPDPTAVLLPQLLRDHGYTVLGVSAHPWVVADCPFGRPFHRLDFLPAEPARGHVDAVAVVDRALAFWQERARGCPTFLYLHLMDLHMPRWLPADGLRFHAGARWSDRFSRASAAQFGAPRRGWDPDDARDFTADDRAIFAAIYDTALAHADAEVGRLLAGVRAEDPDLGEVVIAVAADHGEQLGEEGKTGHTETLVDGIQHVPFVLAGAMVTPGQCQEAFSENVDVVPTLADLLALDLPAGSVDGETLLDRGAVQVSARAAVHYAWLRYQAIRTDAHLLQVEPCGAPEAVGRGRRDRVWRLGGAEREEVTIAGAEAAVVAELRAAINRRLQTAADAFQQRLGGSPSVAFEVPAVYWRLRDGSAVRCPSIGEETRPADLRFRGWLYARESFLVLCGERVPSLEVTVTVPDGTYEVKVAMVPFERPPRVPSLRLHRRFGRWLGRSFKPMVVERFAALGVHAARERHLTVRIPAVLGRDARLTGLRLIPPGVELVQPVTESTDEERAHHARLRALGYVE